MLGLANSGRGPYLREIGVFIVVRRRNNIDCPSVWSDFVAMLLNNRPRLKRLRRVLGIQCKIIARQN
jgi:hypothetical protein